MGKHKYTKAQRKAYYKKNKKKKGPIKNQPKKKFNKNQKKIVTGGYTKKENKAVDLSQEKRIKSLESKMKDVMCLHNIRNPPYNNWINNTSQQLINTWIDMIASQHVQDCYDTWDVTPDIKLPSYFRNVVSGQVLADSMKPIPGMGPIEYVTDVQTPEDRILNRPNTCKITKFKCTFNYRQYIVSPLDSTGDFPKFPLNMEYINNNIFKIRLYLISQPILADSIENKIQNIARQLGGPFQSHKAAKLRVTEGYGNVVNTESNLIQKLKYTVHYDQIIKPKFKFCYEVLTTTGSRTLPTQKVYMISILRSPDILLNRDLEFSTAYDAATNNNPNNLTLHWVMKFADIEQSKFINDQILASTESQQVQYKNEFNIYLKQC